MYSPSHLRWLGRPHAGIGGLAALSGTAGRRQLGALRCFPPPDSNARSLVCGTVTPPVGGIHKLPRPSLPVLGEEPEPAINSLGADSTPAKPRCLAPQVGASATCRTGAEHREWSGGRALSVKSLPPRGGRPLCCVTLDWNSTFLSIGSFSCRQV